MFCQRKLWKNFPYFLLPPRYYGLQRADTWGSYRREAVHDGISEECCKGNCSQSHHLSESRLRSNTQAQAKQATRFSLFIYFIGDFCRGSLHKNQSTFDFSSGFSCVMSTCCWSYLQEILKIQGQIINIPGATAVVVLVLAAVSPDPHMKPTAALSRCV